MERIALATVLLPLLAAAAPAQNLYARAGYVAGAIADHRAQKVGDVLTILIREQTKVKNEDKVDRSNISSLQARLEAFNLKDNVFKNDQLPEIDIRQQREFVGETKQEKDSNFESRISVVVVDVQPNGNLVVAGSRVVQIDDETKTFRISGIVRALDVTRLNQVSSSQVADARVSITGEGGNTRMVTHGPIAEFIDTLLWAAWPF